MLQGGRRSRKPERHLSVVLPESNACSLCGIEQAVTVRLRLTVARPPALASVIMYV